MTKNSSFIAATGYTGHRLYRHPFLVHQDPFSPDKTAGARIASVIPDTTVHFLVPPPDIPDTRVIVHIQYAPLITATGYTGLRLYRQGVGILLLRAFFNMTKNSSFKAATGYSGHRLYRHPFLVPQDPFSPDKTAGARIASVIPDTTVHFLVPPPDIPDTGVIVHISSVHLTHISLTEKHLLE